MNDSATVEPEAKPTLPATGQAKLRQLLFGNPDESTYAVLDGARVPGLVARLRAATEEQACLYRGELKPDLRDRAPYLVKLRAESPFTDWLLREQWGNSAGVFAVTPVGIEALRRHFRGFLRVRDQTGRVLYFRWYDPRVLRVYLPTCNAREIETVYGPISAFFCEAEDPPQALYFPRAPLRVVGKSHAISERKM